MSCEFRAFSAFGRLRVIRPTLPRFSTFTTVYCGAASSGLRKNYTRRYEQLSMKSDAKENTKSIKTCRFDKVTGKRAKNGPAAADMARTGANSAAAAGQRTVRGSIKRASILKINKISTRICTRSRHSRTFFEVARVCQTDSKPVL